MAKSGNLRDRFRRITPVTGMNEYVGSSNFVVLLIAVLLFAFLHQRAISAEMDSGTGGIWCFLGVPALLCLAISSVLACLSAKTNLLPSAVTIAGLGGIATALIMFFVIQTKLMGTTGGTLGTIQEISMLLFLASWFVCILLLMLTGVGLKVFPAAGMITAVISIFALALFVIRAMYTFSSLITALSRNLLMEDGRMAGEVKWVLRSVEPGSEAAQSIYISRLLDCVGIALLMMVSIPLAIIFYNHFSEQAYAIKNSHDIPLPTQHRRVLTGYDDYTAEPVQPPDEQFNMTRDGYYVEKRESERPKFNRRERSESDEGRKRREITSEEEPVYVPPVSQQEYYDPEKDESIEVFDNYVPGEGWANFQSRIAPDNADQPEEPAERKKVVPVQAFRPIPDPNDPDFWNKYRK